jgi:hypothetical protein
LLDALIHVGEPAARGDSASHRWWPSNTETGERYPIVTSDAEMALKRWREGDLRPYKKDLLPAATWTVLQVTDECGTDATA